MLRRSHFVLDKIVPVMIRSGCTPSAAIRRWLVEITDHQLAKAAAEAAILIEDDALAWLALDHARADARGAALDYLANTLPDPLPQQLLELASDPGSRVRRNLIGILAGRPHPDHLSVLLRLIDDNWSDAEVFHNDPPSYPIAREAISGLAAYGNLSDDIGEALLLRAEGTDDRSLGIVALDTAAQCCGPAIRKRIWALSFLDQPRLVRVDAIDALSKADVVESDIVGSITAKLLLRLAPPLAASACVLLAIHGRGNAVIEAMERMAQSEKRRALLLLGVYFLADRDGHAADGAAGVARFQITLHGDCSISKIANSCRKQRSTTWVISVFEVPSKTGSMTKSPRTEAATLVGGCRFRDDYCRCRVTGSIAEQQMQHDQ